MATITIGGTGGAIEGNLDGHNIDVNLDKSLMFDGTNDFIDCGTDTDHDFTDHFTLACWAKNDNASTTGGDREHLIAKYEGSNGKRMYRLYLHGSTLRFGVGYSSGNSSVEITHSMTGLAEHWNHYAASFDGGVMKLYVNGVLVTNTDNSGTLTAIHSNNAIELEIGAYQSGNHTWTGQIADVRIYNAVVDQPDIQLLASKINTDSSLGVGTTNLKGYWKLNNETASGGGSGTGFVVDESGTVNEGTLTNFSGTYWDYDAYSVDVYDNTTTTDGSFTITQGKVEGKALTSLDFERSNTDFVSLASTMSKPTLATYAVWMKPETGGSNYGYPFAESNNKGWYYFTTDDCMKSIGLSPSLTGTTGSVPENVWTHFAVTYDGTTTTWYINGVADVSGTGDHRLDLARLGDDNGDGAECFDGKLRDWKVFDYCLSADQIASLYSGSYNVTSLHHWAADDDGGATLTDAGTATAINGTIDGATFSDGTLDLDGNSEYALIVTPNGTLSAPRGTLDLGGDFRFEDGANFTHNNGLVWFSSSDPNLKMVHSSSGRKTPTNPLVFNNLKTSSSTYFNLYMDFTVEDTFTITNDTTYGVAFREPIYLTMGTASSSGTITGPTSGQGNFYFSAEATGSKVLATDTSGLYPWIYTGNDWGWSSAAGTRLLENGDYRTALVTDEGYHNQTTSSDITIQLTGDMEFDALTVSDGDTFDVNGQRVEFGGDVTYASGSTFDADGLMVFSGGFTKYGTLNNAATSDIMTVGAPTGTPTFSFISGYRTFFTNGGVQLGTGGFSDVSKTVVASGTLTTGTRDTSTSDFTIARGGTFDANDNTHTVSGNFRNGGGLYGDNCLELNGSDEYAYNAGTTWGFEDNFTIEMWFKTGSDADMTLLDMRDDASDDDHNRVHIFSIASANEIRFVRYDKDGATGSGSTTTSNIGYSGGGGGFHDDKWHHIAFVCDSSAGAKIYIDGKLNKTNSHTIDRDSGQTLRMHVGRRSPDDSGSDGGFWNGNISDLRIFSDVRTEAEIRADMFNGDFEPITKTAAYNNDPTITLSAAAYDIVVGMSVSGTGIPAGAYVASITSSTVFELSASTTGGNLSGQTLTFTGMKDRGNLVASYPFTEGSGSDVDNVQGTGARDLALYDAGGAETSGLWIPIGSGGVFTRDGSTVDITGKTSKVTVAHNTTFHGFSVAASGGSTWVTSPQGAGYDFYIAGPFTCNGGVLQPNSGSRFDFSNNGFDIVYNGTDMGTTSVLTMNSSGTVFFPYKDGTSTAQNYGGFSVRGPAALSGDAVINGSFDFGGSNETFNTRGFDISLNSSTATIGSGHTFTADAGTTVTMGHSNGWVNSAGTMKLWGENAAVFPEPQNNTLTRSSIGGTALDMGTGDFSISFWYKSDDSWDREHQIFGNANFYLHLNNAGASAEKLRAYMGDAYVDTGAFNSARLHQNWNHFVVTFDRSDLLKVYVNGSYEANVDISGKSGQDIMGSGNLAIGEANATSGRGWHGSLVDVRFFKGTVLTDGGVSVGQAATGNVASLYNSGLNPATHISSNGEGGNYASDSPTATTWWKLGNTNASGARTTAPALDLTDSSSGSLTLTNTGGVKAGSIFMTKSSGSYSITDSNDTLIMNWRNCKINMNANTELYVSSASQFSGRITLD